MAQPWLDSLSEDWESEPRSSPPPSRPATSQSISGQRVSSSISQSRIPHLAHNIRNNSNGSFLKPRSSRGIARMKENAALSERSPSSLNALPPSLVAGGGKRQPSFTIPRRASSTLSDSQQSVQHYTIDKSSKIADTPEWKRRLKAGDDVTSDGFDLFSPSKLEGIFKQSSCPVEPEEEDENDNSVVVSPAKPWNSLNLGTFPAPSEQYSTHRSSRTQFPDMDTLQEVDEEESKSFDLSAISSDVVRQSDIKGIVRRRVSDLELAKSMNVPTADVQAGQDPRMRTISGRKEMCNEVFSPVEDAERSSIRKQALQETLDTDPFEMRPELRNKQTGVHRRSRSRSSDHDISYDAEGLDDRDHSALPEEPAAELTSQSLPEDLSMGTQNPMDSVLLGGRRASGFKMPVPRKKSASATDTSLLIGQKSFRSSPPPYKINVVEDSKNSVSEPASPMDTSVVHHAPTSTQHSTTGSPLKLFGNRDTYTNNKLMRVLSQFEQDESELELYGDADAFRMSNFGKGELDAFSFVKEVERPVAEIVAVNVGGDKVFKHVALSSGVQHADEVEKTSANNERSPKRRRTLLKDQVAVDGAELEVKVSAISDNTLAGKKRRDALPGKEAEPASPDTLATRPIRRPSGSRKSSANSHSRAASASEALQAAAIPAPELTKQLANELETFAKSVAEIKQDSRKTSLATKDYMEEANKVMEFIRARGKPKPLLPDIREPEEVSELDPDAILDLDLDESTKDSFSRPPSREGRILPRQDRRHAQHDAQTAKHLMKFRDQEDLELLTSTSALGTLQLADNKAVEEAALVPVPEDDALELSVQSDPPGIRILNDNDRKRKHSSSEAEAQHSHSSQNMHSDSSKRTILTNTSTGSGQRGVISIGTVSIPDTIGPMTFDHNRKIWVKQDSQPRKQPAPSASPESRAGNKEVSEVDPFADIPDLSIDEQREASLEKPPAIRADQDADGVDATGEIDGSDAQSAENDPPSIRIASPPKSSLKSPRKQRKTESADSTRISNDVAAKHEELLHNGEPSKDVGNVGNNQPRVVTIAFSSPIASEIPYIHPPSLSEEDIDEDDPSLLPLDDDGSVLASSPVKSIDENEHPEEDYGTTRRQIVMGSLDRHEQYRAMTLSRRTISRIEEYDEDQVDNQELSLIHIKQTEVTPMPERQLSLAKSNDKSSILCLTPLSEFTLHQVDKINHPEESYVAERPNPKALRQAHGSHALVEDALVRAITDAEPTELFWEQLRKLSMHDSGLVSLHGLKQYCSSLEYLDVTKNKVSQLSELPLSLRSLNVSSNLINDLTSWTHLHNLQRVNVSGNQLESLECFSGLVHLRHLNASKNRIRHIEGILDMNGLISLDLSENDIAEADFYSCDLVSLKELDLSKNSMMHIKSLECLPNLKHADFSDNLLENLAIKDERMAPELETLCISKNELVEIDLTAFPMLRRLNIDSNMITDIHGLAEAEHMTILSAREQRTTSNLINNVLNTPHECTELYLSSNSIPEHGIQLPQAPNFTLRCLELASCGIQNIPQGFGDAFPNMRVLNLNFNAISELSSLQGSIKLKQLLLAKNRIKKMRRTCLTLSRLDALRRIELRDNPLTVGFYSPLNDEKKEQEVRPNRLPARTVENDEKWIGLMDEMTWLRRRAMELLLTQCCKGLDEVDGLRFDRDVLVKQQATWERLMGKGVLKKDDQAQEEKEKETTIVVNEVADQS